MIDEGYVKFDMRWAECELPHFEESESLHRWRAPLFAAGLVGHYAEQGIGYGNVSMRIGDGSEFLITGTQTGHVPVTGDAQLALVTHADIRGNRVVCRGAVRASSESLTHAQLYALDPAIRAVVHIHSDALWREYLDRMPTTSKDTPYGTPEMADEFARLYRRTGFPETRLAVMGGHESGIISIGGTMAEAAQRVLGLHARVA